MKTNSKVEFDLSDFIFILGFVLLSAGLWLVYIPLSLIFIGIVLIAFAVIKGRTA